MDFDKRSTRYERDAVGRAVATIKPDGARLEYSYDRTGLTTRIEAFGPDRKLQDKVAFTYDRRGLLVEAKNGSARVEYIRDRNGRIVEEDVNGRRAKSRYDARGRRIERRVFSGVDQPHEVRIGEHFTRYAYDPLGAVAEIMVGDHAPLAFGRDALGREVERRSARGFSLSQGWDAGGRLSEQRTRLMSRRFGWTRADGLASISGGPFGDVRYAHDTRGLIARAEWSDGFAETFSYDAALNVEASGASRGEEKLFGAHERPGLTIDKRFSQHAPRTGWLRSSGGLVAMARGPNGEKVTLEHDACGRVATRRVERKGFRPRMWEYTWDAFDRLIGCEDADGRRWSYAYDPFGRRIAKRCAYERNAPPEIGRAYAWDGDHLLEDAPLKRDGQADWAAAVRWQFEPGAFRPLAREARINAELEPRDLIYVTTDHLGAPRELSDERGDVIAALDYTVWGALRKAEAPANDNPAHSGEFLSSGARAAGNLALKLDAEEIAELCPLRFPGQWADAETGLYYNRHRHYDPLAGQYASPDPIGLQGGPRPQGYVARPTELFDAVGLRVSNVRQTTDSLGRPTSWTWTTSRPDIGTGTATNQYTRDFARSRGNDDDDAGHARPRNQGGSGTDPLNIFPQARGINRGQFRIFEAQVAQRVQDTGTTADSTLTPTYEGNSFRPSSLNYNVQFSDGTTWVRNFQN